MAERDTSIDLVRTIACLMVILMHSPKGDNPLGGVVYHIIDMIALPCVGLFYMISGYLLLPSKDSCFVFLRKRLGKILIPTIVFSILTLSIDFLCQDITFQKYIINVCSIPFSTYKSGVLWFMYPLIGMYLITPIISPFLEKAKKSEILFILSLWIITLCWNPISLFLNVDTSNESMLHLFSGYTGFYILGFYIRKFPFKLPVLLFPILYVIPFIADASNKIFGWGVSKYDYFWYLSVFCIMHCVFWFQIVKQYELGQKLSVNIKNILIVFSNCSFGIYLMHRIIMQRIVWPLNFLNEMSPIIQVIMILLMTLMISWVVTYTLSLLSFGEYIVGFKQKRIINQHKS